MLNLSKTQLNSIQRTIGGRFEDRLGALVHELRPEVAARATPEDLQRFLAATMEQASAFGFETEFEVAVFCAGVLQHGRALFSDSNHPLHEVVTRPGVEPSLRANQLLYELERTERAPDAP